MQEGQCLILQLNEAYGARRDFLDWVLKQPIDGASFSDAGKEFQHLGAMYFIDRWLQRCINRFVFADLVLCWWGTC